MTNKYTQAFTYGVYPEAPENEATDYVDPDLYNAIQTRFTDITADIAFPGKSLTGAGGILREVSKFNGTYYAQGFATMEVEPSRKGYHELPLVTCNMTRHNFSIIEILQTSPLMFKTNTPNGVYNGQRFLFQNFTSSNPALQTAINNQNFYIRKDADDRVALFYDQALTQPFDASAIIGLSADISKDYEVAISLVSATAIRNADGTFTPSFRLNTWAAHGMHNSARITLNGFSYYAFLNGRTFYVKTFDAYPNLLELYLDDQLTQAFDVTSYASEYDLTGITGTASFTANVNVADIAESAPTVDATSRQIRITTDSEHGLIAGVHDFAPALPVIFTNSTYINFGNVPYYVKVVDNFTLDLYLDNALTVPARLADVTYNKSGTVVSADALNITWNGLVGAEPLKLQSASNVSSVTGRSIRFSTNDLGLSTTTDYYLKAVGTNFAEVYTDEDLTVPFTIANVGADTYGTATIGNTQYPEYVSISGYRTFTITKSVGSIQINAGDSAFRTAQGITGSADAYRVFYTQQPTGTDVTQINHPANKIAFSQRVRAFTDVSPYPYTDCFATVDWLPVTYDLGNNQTAYLYIVKYFSDRACTVPVSINSVTYNKVQSDSYNKFYITSYLSLNGVKMRVTGKSASTDQGPWTGVATSGAAKYNAIWPTVSQRAMVIKDSTAYPTLNNGYYYTKATFYTETHNDTSDSIVYDVELFSDSGLTVPTTLPAITKSIASVVGTLTTSISNASHRTLRYVPIVDKNSVIQSGDRYTFSGAYKNTINGTHYVKVIRRYQYTGMDKVTLVELYANADLSGLIDTTLVETASDNTTYSYALSNKVYSNLYMPKVIENGNFPYRNGLRLTMSGTHIPYINGNTYYTLDYVEPSANDDYDIGRHRLDFYTDAEFANRVDLKALAYAGTIPKLDYVADHSVIPGNPYSDKYNTGYNIWLASVRAGGDTTWVSTNSDWHFNDGEYIHVGGDYDQWAYIEYVESESTATNFSNYRLWANSNLTGAVTLTVVFPTVSTSTPVYPSSNENYPWKVSSINKFIRGNQSFQHWNETLNGGSGGYEFAPFANDFVARAGIVNGYGDRPSFTFTPRAVDDWRIGDVTLNAADPGKFANNAAVAIVFTNAADIGSVPGTSFDPELGIFDVKDEWTSTSYSANKVWPTHIMPSSATIRTEQPTRITTSQSMQRYARSSGNIRYSIDLEYAPMHQDEFAKFRAVIEAMQGQLVPVMLPLDVVFKDPLQTISKANLFNNTQMPTTNSVLNIEGVAANDAQAIRQGQFIQILDTAIAPNGGIAVALHDAASNSWGETAVRITHPLRSVLDEYTDVNLRPEYVVVTMNSDSTEYNVSTSLHYTLKVTFVLQGWA